MTRLLLALLIGGALSTAALASEESERLYSRGLVDFHAEHYADALKQFDAAVAADGKDLYARYYRGVTRGRLEDYKGAASDLREVVAAKPDFDQAALELGVALVQSGASRDAVPWLTQAQRVPENAAQAALFLGIAQLRLDDIPAARAEFARAAQDPALRDAARYYEGVCDYREGKLAEAETAFNTVATSTPDSALGREATAFLARVRGGGAAAPARAYSLYAAAGFLYDSNVVLAPANEALKSGLGISKQSDGAATLEVGGTVAPWRGEHTELSLGYDFYQSLYFDLDQFDIQDHRPTVQFLYHNGPVQAGILGRYDYYFLRADSFLQDGTGLPWVSVQSGNAGRTDVYFRFRRRDFLKKPFSGLRDALNYSPGVVQYFYLGAPERYVSLGYRFDREDPVNASGDQYGYDGNEVSAGGGWAFAWGISADAEAAYRHETYQPQSASDPSGAPGQDRRDDEYQAVFGIHKELTEHLRVSGTYYGTWNNSNKKAFEYDRNVGAVTLEGRF